MMFVVFFVHGTLFKQTRILLDVWTGLHREEHSPHFISFHFVFLLVLRVFGVFLVG